MNTTRHRRSAAALSLLVLTAVVVADSRLQEQRYRERQELDPETGRWQEVPPETGPPDDDLSRARALLAAEEPKKAREILESWVERNPASERYW